MNRKKIYVSVCSYRDPLLIYTVRSLLEQSSNDNNIVVGIFEQTAVEDSLLTKYPEFLEEYDRTQTVENHGTIVKGVLYKQIDPMYSDGVGWARHINQYQMDLNHCDFMYQVDSHMLFEKDWDKTLIENYNEGVIKHGNSKVIITGPCKVFEYNDGEFNLYPLEDTGGMVKFPDYFPDTYMLNPTGVFRHVMPEVDEANHLFAGNTFFPVSWIREGGNSIEMFFDGEEFRLTLDAFQKGYGMFFAKKIVSYHYRDVHNYITKQWVDPVATTTRYTRNVWRSHVRLKEFIESMPEQILADFAKYSGLDYVNKKILSKALI